MTTVATRAMTLTERLVNAITPRLKEPSRATEASRHRETSRRGFLGRATLVGAALAINPWGYLVRPANAYDAVCGAHSNCADGYSVFCCTINGGSNTCPPNSFIGGWWKADNSSFCGGSARYYIDCNAYRDGAWQCHCNETTCDQRRVACNQFRYGQCGLEIPYANTGPVVCRMISCTPPWEQFAGNCGSSSATDNKTATHTAPCLSGHAPVGSVDALSVAGTTLNLRGWALDQDEPGTEVQVVVYVDGQAIGVRPTGKPRSDVNGAYGVPGNHGFEISLQAGWGNHTVDVYALNVGGGSSNPLLGSRTVTLGTIPIGNLDGLSTGPDSTIRMRGWAYDPDEPGTESQVAVYCDGVGIGWFATGRSRSDVNSVFNIPGDHGFDISITSTPGDHTVDVLAINVGGGVGNPLLGSGRVTVGVPKGNLDGLTATSGKVRLTGWAFDPDQPTTETQVAVYRDGAGIAWFPTGGSRPDVNSAFGISGNHGFDISVDSPAGQHRFDVFAINVGPASGNPVVGSGTVQV